MDRGNGTPELIGDKRNGDWMETYTGIRFYPLDAREEEIHIVDIAHALSLQCRFNGHCKEFYSVAQHSVLVSDLLPKGLKLAGLLHDAAEAYLGDMIRPLKNSMVQYKDAEWHLEKVIAKSFGLQFPFPAAVKQADDFMLWSEGKHFGMKVEDWGYSPGENYDIKIPVEFWCLSAGQVEKEFLRVYKELTR